jgi:hypothetical protein
VDDDIINIAQRKRAVNDKVMRLEEEDEKADEPPRSAVASAIAKALREYHDRETKNEIGDPSEKVGRGTEHPSRLGTENAMRPEKQTNDSDQMPNTDTHEPTLLQEPQEPTALEEPAPLEEPATQEPTALQEPAPFNAIIDSILN